MTKKKFKLEDDIECFKSRIEASNKTLKESEMKVENLNGLDSGRMTTRQGIRARWKA
jgi:hypothetical protein